MADKKVSKAKITSNAKGYRTKCLTNDQADAELVARAHFLHERYDLSVSHLADCLIAGSTPPNTHLRRESA